jgi:hypothetical protein
MVEYRIEPNEIEQAMKPGGIDVLTVVSKDQILQTISFLRNVIEGSELEPRSETWNKFWAYFDRTWLNLYEFDVWNISEALKSGLTLTNRTNNALESHNRVVNDMFKNKPNMHTFIEGIKELSHNTVVPHRTP